MKWYVLRYDINKRKIVSYNIFDNAKLIRGLNDLLVNYNTYDEFLNELDSLLKYCFWCKSEYEVLIGDLFMENVNECEKIDIYTQLKPNIELLTSYALDYFKENV